MKKEALLAALAAGLLRALAATLRIECRDLAGYFAPARRGPILAAVWHNRILLLPVVFARYRGGQRLVVLTSASRDGGLLAAVVRHFGVQAVRGSSSRRGGQALRELQGKLEEGCDIIITPDGPRGPRYEMSPGLLFLAEKTGFPMLPIHAEYSRYWELKSWDGFRIPKPFSKVIVTLQPLEKLRPIGTDEEFELARQAFTRQLHPESYRAETATL
jgi:lysophospholipid acyltransferase (LPLAT)-like uncharacterized protein